MGCDTCRNEMAHRVGCLETPALQLTPPRARAAARLAGRIGAGSWLRDGPPASRRTPLTSGADERRPFTLAGRLPGALSFLSRAAAAILDGSLGLRALQRLYDDASRKDGSFVDRALAALDVGVEAKWGHAPVPAAGPLVVVANHPFGILDGLAVLWAVRSVRRDVKVLANGLLGAIPEMAPLLVAVNPFGQAAGSPANATGLRAALNWVTGGGCLVTFPAGEVAHECAGPELAIDGEWHPHVAGLAVRASARVLPVFVAGANSRLFCAAGHVHPVARTALLPRELLARRGRPVRLVVGEPIESRALEAVPRGDRAAHLRARTYLLAARLQATGAPGPEPAAGGVPIVAPAPAARVAADVERLAPDRKLASIGGIDVYWAGADELPYALQEIGRLREETFRGAGEGTGRSSDLDRFDETYWHLFAWDPSRACLVGAYRLGATDRIVPREGAGGLYTNTLFHYDERLLDEIGPALELGRSFVRAEYQRGFAPLLALWTGVGRFVARNPQYRRLLGAVSISSRYDSVSRQLLVRFLSVAAAHPSGMRLVRPRRPLPIRRLQERILPVTAATSLESVSELVRAIEKDGKPMPVLLRQYLNLNARLLAFSVDPDFGDAVDGLMLADLTEVPRVMLQRLMGREAAARFLACHLDQRSPSGAALRPCPSRPPCMGPGFSPA